MPYRISISTSQESHLDTRPTQEYLFLELKEVTRKFSHLLCPKASRKMRCFLCFWENELILAYN